MKYLTDNSIFQSLLVVISYLIAEPNMRAIMQNLTATSLWELGRLASKTFRFRRAIGSGRAHVAPQLSDGAEGLTTVMLAAIDSLRDHSGEITFKTQRSRHEKTELKIKLTDGISRVTSASMPVANRGTHSERERSKNLVLFD